MAVLLQEAHPQRIMPCSFLGDEGGTVRESLARKNVPRTGLKNQGGSFWCLWEALRLMLQSPGFLPLLHYLSCLCSSQTSTGLTSRSPHIPQRILHHRPSPCRTRPPSLTLPAPNPPCPTVKTSICKSGRQAVGGAHLGPRRPGLQSSFGLYL